MGGPCFRASTLALPLPLFFPFEDLFAMVEWIAWTSEVLPGLGEFWEGLLEAVFETDFYFEEDFARAWDTKPIIPSTRGVACDFNVIGLDDGLRALGNNSYKVPY